MMHCSPPVMTRVSRRLLCNTRLGHALSRSLSLSGFQHYAQLTSRCTQFVPPIVSFDRVGAVRLPGSPIQMTSADGDDHVVRSVWYHGAAHYESPLPEIVSCLSMQSRGSIVVGANTGFYVLIAAACAAQGKVHAFEPYPRARDAMIHNVALSQLTDRIEVIPKAVGDLEGTASFFLPVPRFGSTIETAGSLSTSFHTNIGQTCIVEVATLDGWMRHSSLCVDLLQIDAEGYEAAVLRGGRHTIRQHRPHVILEVLENRGADLDFLNQLCMDEDYVVFQLMPGRIERQSAIIPNVASRNQWLVPAERLGQATCVANAITGSNSF